MASGAPACCGALWRPEKVVLSGQLSGAFSRVLIADPTFPKRFTTNTRVCRYIGRRPARLTGGPQPKTPRPADIGSRDFFCYSPSPDAQSWCQACKIGMGCFQESMRHDLFPTSAAKSSDYPPYSIMRSVYQRVAAFPVFLQTAIGTVVWIGRSGILRIPGIAKHEQVSAHRWHLDVRLQAQDRSTRS